MPSAQDDFNASYAAIRSQLKGGVGASSGGSVSKEDVFWAVIEGVAAVLDGALGTSGAMSGAGAGASGGGLKLIYDCIQGRGFEPAATPNPWFVWNGHDDNPTSYTRQYLKNRMKKGLAGSAIAVAGAGVSFVSVVDVGAIAQHGNAVGSTAAHIYKFHVIAKSYKETRTISNWLHTILVMKSLKAGIRGAGLAGACIPVPAVGAVTGVLAAAAKIGAKLTMTKVCLATAADLHWRAYQELVLTRSFGGTGPALRIMHELFQRRGATRIFGQYDVHKIIREPNGWMAVQDKLMLI